MASCRNTGSRSAKFYNNKKSKPASEFIISGAIKSFVHLETKKGNKQTDFNQQFESMSVNSSKFIMGVPNYHLLKTWKGIGM